jgi:Flp pilus assembly protein TadG
MQAGYNYMMRQLKKNSGQGTTELALLLPVLFLMFFGAVQIIIFLQSSTMTQYASFVSARAFQVYGDRNLKSINYYKVASLPYTNDGQTIAEAAAESVIFEKFDVGTTPRKSFGSSETISTACMKTETTPHTVVDFLKAQPGSFRLISCAHPPAVVIRDPALKFNTACRLCFLERTIYLKL